MEEHLFIIAVSLCMSVVLVPITLAMAAGAIRKDLKRMNDNLDRIAESLEELSV